MFYPWGLVTWSFRPDCPSVTGHWPWRTTKTLTWREGLTKETSRWILRIKVRTRADCLSLWRNSEKHFQPLPTALFRYHDSKLIGRTERQPEFGQDDQSVPWHEQHPPWIRYCFYFSYFSSSSRNSTSEFLFNLISYSEQLIPFPTWLDSRALREAVENKWILLEFKNLAGLCGVLQINGNCIYSGDTDPSALWASLDFDQPAYIPKSKVISNNLCISRP